MRDEAVLPTLFKALRLTTCLHHWEALMEEARSHGWSHAKYLATLCEQELAGRQQRRIQRHHKEGRLLAGKTLATFDFKDTPSVKPTQVEALANNRRWVDQAENLLIFGPSGVGKSHIACAIGHGLIQQGLRVLYSSTLHMVQHLLAAKAALTLPSALAKLDKFSVLILDDMGYVKKNDQETHVLFELIADRYETHSLIITCNQPFSEWDQIFADTTMTVAAIDRLVHHATILEINEQSYRRKHSLNQTQLLQPTSGEPS